MSLRRFAPILVAVAIVALFAVPATWSGLPGPSAAPAPAAAPHPSPAPGVSAAPALTAAVPHPGIICPIPFPFYGQEGANGQAWPLVPDQIWQLPCAKLSLDEVHATFASSAAASGERWTIPVHVPVDGSTFQTNSYVQFYAGMVTSGDALSEWRQTFTAVTFQPLGQPVSTYQEDFHVWSLMNTSFTGGTCPVAEITWNDSFYCILDDILNTSAPTVNLVPGDWVNVTFVGAQSQTTGMWIYANDTTTPADTISMQLSNANTSNGNFEPFYTASCVDTCTLDWGVKAAYGLGVGFLHCPWGGSGFAQCDSYNDTTYNGTHPVEFGIPHFWQNGGYNGDYRYFAPVSSSGVCNNAAPPGTLSFCFNTNTLGGTGYYPSFSYNGSDLSYGVSRSWTTQDWGGTVFELLGTGAPNDITPFYFLTVGNDSRAGFVPAGATVGVTTHLQDLGNVRYAGVTYRVNNGAPTSIAMSRVSGTPNDGLWAATIPSGPNGWINFTVNATNNASATLLTPAAGTSYHVQRGPLPTFDVNVSFTVGGCGLRINGTTYASGSVALLQPGTYPILAIGCYPYVFAGWSLSKGITVSPTGSLIGNVTVSASGAVSASWQYVRPLDTLRLYTNPTFCGQIIVAGQSYFPNASGSPVQVLDSTNVSLGEGGCGGFSFSGWNFTGSFTILGNNLVAQGNGSLYANFVSSASAFTILFHTTPPSCGGVLFQGAGYTDGQSLAELGGTYAIGGDPCFHWGLLSFTTTGGLSISNGILTVTGSGTITETNYVLTIVTFVTSPASCGTLTFDGTTYVNGDWIVVANNSTHSVSADPCPGYYLFSITGTGGVTVVGPIVYVNGSGDVIATFFKGNATNFVGFLTDPSTCGAIYLSGVRYTSSNYTYVGTGSTGALSPQPCGSYGFVKWITFGGITILNSTAYFSGPGAIEAVFRPLAPLFLYTSPFGCGSIEVANTSYLSNSTLTLTEDKAYTLGATPCTGYAFSQWINSSGALIVGPTLTLTTGAVLTATFLPVRYAVSIEVNPARCGGVRVSGQDIGNGTVLTLAHGTFTISPSPCAGDHLVRWDLTGNLSITNTTLWVNGSGTITAIYQPVPPTVTIDVFSGSYAGILVPFGATVAVLVPPYTYTYTWDFGDGVKTSTPVNFTSHSYGQAGFYHVTVTVTDPYNRTANASSTIQVFPAASAQLNGLTTLSLVAIGLAAAAVIAVIVIGSRIRRPPPEPTPSLMASPTPGPYDGAAPPNETNEMEPPKP